MAHVLIVEDSVIMARTLQRGFERTGFQVTIAHDGWEAFQALTQQKVDAVVTDYTMPGLNGEQLCERLRADERFRALPIILTTGRGYEIDVEALRQRFSLAGVFMKPFSLRDLVDTVRTSVTAQQVTRG